MTSVVLIGALDTKGEEYAFLRERVALHGCRVSIVDVGVLASPGGAQIGNDAVAAAAGVTLAELAGDRARAVAAMARGAAEIARKLYAEGELDAVLSVGGSNAAVIFAAVAAALPFGVPKMLVSTVAAGDTRPYVGTTDLALLYPVVDINGLNRMSRRCWRTRRPRSPAWLPVHRRLNTRADRWPRSPYSGLPPRRSSRFAITSRSRDSRW